MDNRTIAILSLGIVAVGGLAYAAYKLTGKEEETEVNENGQGAPAPVAPTENHPDLLGTALGINLSGQQRTAIQSIRNAFAIHGDGDVLKLAYVYATAYHESRFRPVRECFAESDQAARQCVASRSYGQPDNETGHVYYGRGFVQLTWKSNYRKMEEDTGIGFVWTPDLALDNDYAAEILVSGMMRGRFTGKRLSDYINGGTADFVGARRIVNGTDKNTLIAGYADSIITHISQA